MGRFRVDDPKIDVEELEARVEARIAEKTGTRFTVVDLEVLRRAALRPRLERHHLSYGVLEEMPQIRGKLSSVEPPPGATAVQPPKDDPVADVEDVADVEGVTASEAIQPREISPRRDLYTSGSRGLKGRLIGLLRRCLRPVVRTSSNLEHLLVTLVAEMRRQDQWLGDVASEAQDARHIAQDALKRNQDALKRNLDERIDRTADWVGAHQSQMIGQLEGRHETQLHLLHNLVYELSYARINMDSLQDQISELKRQFETLEARERMLEYLSMNRGED
ncbi:MAG TPA: hypothetical protein QGG47_12470 [Acidobacteriota bacterium]|nr:hypothetical protein [Acidobacteriota bacterium]